MADDETQGSELTSWWASDALDDSSLPPTTFDEPLVWPESPSWGDPEGAGAAGGGFHALLDQPGEETGLLFPSPTGPGEGPESDAQWRPSDEAVDPDATVHHPGPERPPERGAGPLAALGGGAPARTAPNVRDDLPWPAPVGSRSPDPHTGNGAQSPELGSIWSNDFRSDPENLAGFAGLPAPAIYADTERSGGRRSWRRFDIRPGNAAVIGLISVVSLVLLGMFLSVRARNDPPTDTTQGQPADEISVARPPSTTPLTTTATSTTTTLVPGINIAELLPPTETTGDAGGSGTASGASGAGASTATTTAAARTAAPTGGGGGGTTPSAAQPAATSPPATQPPATAPPDTQPPATSPPVTAPPVTSPPDDDTPPTTRRPLPPPPAPTVPTFTVPTYTVPSFPSIPSRD